MVRRRFSRRCQRSRQSSGRPSHPPAGTNGDPARPPRRADERAGSAPDLLRQRGRPAASNPGHWNSTYACTTKAARACPARKRPAKPPFRLSRTPQRTRWKWHASRSGSCSPSLPAKVKGTRSRPARSSRAWSASSARPGADGTGPCCAPFGPRSQERRDGRRLSVDHEEAWLIIAGFLLRPGFGVVGDDLRIDALWRVHDAGPCFPGRRIKSQEYILWRRVAGGLTRERQSRLLAGELDRIRSGKAPDELVRLAGSLELIPHDMKAELVHRFLDIAVTLARAKQHCAPYLAALGTAAQPNSAPRRARDCRFARPRRARVLGLPGFRLD